MSSPPLPLLATWAIAFAGGCMSGEAQLRVPDFAPDAQVVRDADVDYHLLVDRFADGDQWNNESFDRADPSAFHGGDLRGVLDHIEHLRDLGVGSVWLSPIAEFVDSKRDGVGAFTGTWTWELGRVESRFGDLQSAVTLSQELKRRRMDLGLDLVLSQVASGAPVLQDHPDWAGPGTAPGAGMVALDLSRDPVRHYLSAQVGFWVKALNPSVLFIRDVDAIPPDQLHALIVAMHDRAHARNGDLRVVGDARGTTPRDLARVLLQTGLSAVFDHPLRRALVDVYCRGVGPGRLGTVLSQDRVYEDPHAQLITALDTLGAPRFAAVCAQAGGGPVEHQQALAFLLSSRGHPLLSYGTEFGMSADSLGDLPWSQAQPYAATIREFSDARRGYASLTEGAQWIFDLQADRVLGVARVLPDGASVIIVNRGQEQATVVLPEALRDGAAMTTFHEVDSAQGPFQRHQLIANAADGPRRVRPFFVGPDTTVVAHIEPDQPGAFAELYEHLLEQPDRLVSVRFRVDDAGVLDAGPQDRLVISGQGRALGDWKQADALWALPQRAGGWLSPPIQLHAGAVIEWHLGVRRAGGQIEWEPAPQRWSLVGDPDGDDVIELHPAPPR